MHQVSAVLITKNEEKNIGKTLAALATVADEIIVVDNHSTDATAGICRSFGAKVFLSAWRGYGPQKNYGIQQASFENIIAVDADEVLSPEAIKGIEQLKENGFRGVYELPLKNYYFGKFLRRKDYKKRIFNKNDVRWNNNEVHEALVIPDNYPVIKLQGVIQHYSYHSITQYLAKSNLYSSIAARELFDKDKKGYLAKMLFSPGYTFFQSYILKAGFMDGWHGFVVAWLNSYTSFLKYAKLWELCRQQNNQDKTPVL